MSWHDRYYIVHPGWDLILSPQQNHFLRDIRSDLKNLRGFSFDQHPEFQLPDTRVNQLNKIVRTQIQQILY